MKNILTVDLEDWFSVETMGTVFDQKDWNGLTSVVERNTHRILRIFNEAEVKATFFVLGWVAENYPGLVSRIASAGHEIACHSYLHRMVSSLNPDDFYRDTEMAISAIDAACGVRPAGYRSPTWGMKRDMLWAYEILADFGFIYDSSIFPISHDLYGDPQAPRRVHELALSENRKIIELPASTVMILGRRFPVAGGGWLRQLPYWFTHWGIKKLNREGIPAIVYFHPWELDTDLPRVDLGWKNRIRQYGNLNTMESKVRKLLNDFDFLTINEYIKYLKRPDNDSGAITG